MGAHRAAIFGIVANIGCGRIGFDANEQPLQIWPSRIEVGVGASIQFHAVDGVAPYTFELISGGGVVSSSGAYTAPATSGAAVVRVTDAADATSDASVTLFAPVDLPGVRLWLDANTIPDLGDLAPVATWTDRSGSGLDAVQADPAKRPVYVADGLNGRPAVKFTTPTTAMRTAPLALGAFTIASVFRATNTGIVYEHGLGNWLQTSVGNTINTEHGGSGTSYDLGPLWGQLDQPRIVIHRFDGTHAGHTLRVNGVGQSLATVSGGQPGTDPWTAPFDIGSSGDGADWWLDGAIAELVLYDGALAAGDVDRLECYLGERYAIDIERCRERLEVRPPGAIVRPGGTVGFTIEGGLAPYELRVVAGEGEIDTTGRFIAPAIEGASVVRIADRVGNEKRVVVETTGTIPSSGLQLWLRAGDLALLDQADGSAVGDWWDVGGRGHRARQAVAARQPHLRVAGIDGQPALHCDGAAGSNADFLAIDYPALSAFTVVVVFSATALGVVWAHSHDVWMQTATGTTVQVTHGALASAKDASGDWGSDGVPRIASHVFDGTHAGHRLYVNGVELGLQDVDVADPGLAPYRAPLMLCGWIADFNLQGMIGEILVYDRVLDPVERQAVEGYLNARYHVY